LTFKTKKAKKENDIRNREKSWKTLRKNNNTIRINWIVEKRIVSGYGMICKGDVRKIDIITGKRFIKQNLATEFI